LPGPLRARIQDPDREGQVKKIILTVGLPRSGKSTWARQQGLPIINPDAFRLALHGEPFLAKAEPMVWTLVFTCAEALLLAGNSTIIVDATNVSEKRRAQWATKFPDCEIELKVFDTSPEVCVERAILTGQEHLVPIIRQMAEEWDLLKPETVGDQAPTRRKFWG
jgi:predicted kinase